MEVISKPTNEYENILDVDVRLYDNKEAARRLQDSLLRFFPGDKELVFLGREGYRGNKVCKISEIVDNYEELSQFHYLFYNFYSHHLVDRDKKNSPFILIDIDAEIQSERDEILNEISGDKELSKRLLWIVTKDPVHNKSISKHLYGTHAVLYTDSWDKHIEIKKRLMKFPCVDRMMTYSCFKNPIYKYFKYIKI